jgi:hypothetical protein
MTDPCTHVVILRAADDDPEGRNAQVKIGHVGEPSQSTLDQYRAGIIELFRASFSEEPARVGVAVLPWVGELDDDEREEAA